MDTLELVLRLSGGAALVCLKKTAGIIGLEAQTVRNQLCSGKFALSPVRLGRAVFFRVDDIAKLLDAAQPQPRPRRGRPTNKERQQRQR